MKNFLIIYPRLVKVASVEQDICEENAKDLHWNESIVVQGYNGNVAEGYTEENGGRKLHTFSSRGERRVRASTIRVTY